LLKTNDFSIYSATARKLQFFASIQIQNVASLAGKRDNPFSDAFNFFEVEVGLEMSFSRLTWKWIMLNAHKNY